MYILLEKSVDIMYEQCVFHVVTGSGVWTSRNVGRNIIYFPFNDLDPALEGFVRFWTYLIIYQVRKEYSRTSE